MPSTVHGRRVRISLLALPVCTALIEDESYSGLRPGRMNKKRRKEILVATMILVGLVVVMGLLSLIG